MRPARRPALAALALGLAACADPAPVDPNVLLIVSDALRADALSCYGGAARTPRICGLAREGVLFERAYSGGSWTLPASVSMFTGNHASEYARFGRPREDARWLGDRFLFVDDAETLLAEALAERGYDAFAYLENEIPRQANQLQGFESVSLFRAAAALRMSDAAARELGIDPHDERQRRLLPVLRRLEDAGERPFLLLHWIRDPHAAYRPPDRWLERLRGRAADLPRPLGFYTQLGSPRDPVDLRAYAKRMTRAERDLLVRLYLAEVESVDERVGVVLDALEREGLRERTLVVFTSDHGEGFGEHGRFLHGKTFWNELVHVPLIVSGPGIARGERVGRPVSHVDLVPTLRDLLDVEGLREDVRGRSLAGLLRRGSAGRRPRGPRPRYLVNEAPEHGGDALVAGRFKLIAWGGGDRKLFDLSADRHERADLSRERPELLETLTRALHRIRADDARRWERNAASGDADRLGRVHAETLEQLRAMGYVE